MTAPLKAFRGTAKEVEWVRSLFPEARSYLSERLYSTSQV